MESVIVIGGDTGLGQVIVRRLRQKGMDVLGFGENFSGLMGMGKGFRYYDYQGGYVDRQEVVRLVGELQQLVGVIMVVEEGEKKPYWDYTLKDLEVRLDRQVVLPQVVLGAVIKELVGNHGVVIPVVRGGEVGSVVGEGLRGWYEGFGKGLFREGGGYGLRVTTVHCEYRDEGKVEGNYGLVADAVERVMMTREGGMIGDIYIREKGEVMTPGFVRNFDLVEELKGLVLPARENRPQVPELIATPLPGENIIDVEYELAEGVSEEDFREEDEVEDELDREIAMMVEKSVKPVRRKSTGEKKEAGEKKVRERKPRESKVEGKKKEEEGKRKSTGEVKRTGERRGQKKNGERKEVKVGVIKEGKESRVVKVEERKEKEGEVMEAKVVDQPRRSRRQQRPTKLRTLDGGYISHFKSGVDTKGTGPSSMRGGRRG